MENIKTAEERFFVDQRVGNIAVRDREHPQYNSSYPGLHQDTPDVIFYAHGSWSKSGWSLSDFSVQKAHSICERLNASLQSSKDKERIAELEKAQKESVDLLSRSIQTFTKVAGVIAMIRNVAMRP